MPGIYAYFFDGIFWILINIETPAFMLYKFFTGCSLMCVLSCRYSLIKKDLYLNVRNLLIIIGIYIVVLFFSFLIEYICKKKTMQEIKGNAKGIFLKITILFAFIILMSYFFALMGIRPRS